MAVFTQMEEVQCSSVETWDMVEKVVRASYREEWVEEQKATMPLAALEAGLVLME